MEESEEAVAGGLVGLGGEVVVEEVFQKAVGKVM